MKTNKGNKRKTLALAIAILCGLFFAPRAFAAEDLIWACAIGGADGAGGNAITLDDSGNVYTTGGFSGTADFDPGPDIHNLTSTEGGDIFVSKLDSTGAFVWARAMGGADYDSGGSIAVDGSGNVFTTGYLRDTVDFDPGPGTYNLTSAGGNDIFVSKLDSTGAFAWAMRFGGTGLDGGRSVAVDGSGNVYTTGLFHGTVDFDPGPGTYDLIPAGDGATFVSKLDSAGAFVWAKQFGSGSGADIALDGSGNVYTTGDFHGTVDFDPGAGTYNLTSAGDVDIFVSKLDSTGALVWARAMGGTSGDFGYAIAVGGSGNVYTTGHFYGTADFDPGPGTYNLTLVGEDDMFVSKLDSAGTFVWAKQFGGVESDFGLSVAVDGAGNVYTTGYFEGTTDFDPGPATHNLTSAGGNDIFISKLNSSGAFVRAMQFGDTDWDWGRSIAVDGPGNVYTTGSFNGTVDFDPGVGACNLTSAGGSNPFVLKLGDGPPSIHIGRPSSIATETEPVTYTITYSGADAVTLAPEDITLNRTGTADGSVSVSGTGNTTRTVTISNITGCGAMGITIAAGTASDASANTALSAGPSQTFLVGAVTVPMSCWPMAVALLVAGTCLLAFPINTKRRLKYAISARCFFSRGIVVLVLFSAALGILTPCGNSFAQSGFGAPAILNSNAQTDLGDDSGVSMATDASGNWVAVWHTSDTLGDTIGSDSDILFSRSTDNGMTWTSCAALNGNAASDSSSDSYPRIATDGVGNLVTVWRSYGIAGTDADILFARSTDNGATWTTQAALNAEAATDSEDDVIPWIATDGSGTWVVAWEQIAANNARIIEVSRSTDNGATWTSPSALNSPVNNGYPPRVATDGAGNWLVTWNSIEDLGGTIGDDYDILMSRSTDNGLTWSGPSALNTNAATDSGWDTRPYLAIDASSTWLTVWHSNDSLGGIGTDTDILFARSTDSGASWTAPAALNTNASFDVSVDYSPHTASDGAGNWATVWRSTNDFNGRIGTDYDILMARSWDDGATWSQPAELNLNAVIDSGDDLGPQIATDGAGNWMTAWCSNDDLGGTTGSDRDILVVRMDNTTSPDVIVNQAVGQWDWINALPITFDVSFSRSPITGFDEIDVTMGGTATGVTFDVTGSGATYTISVTDVRVDGTLVPTIPAAVCQDEFGNPNNASTSIDNSVTLDRRVWTTVLIRCWPIAIALLAVGVLTLKRSNKALNG
ncbi:SBBP repeat-containing protein [Candidatus Hydrogenedentota bacterium]